jgi:hypothetical protein
VYASILGQTQPKIGTDLWSGGQAGASICSPRDHQVATLPIVPTSPNSALPVGPPLPPRSCHPQQRIWAHDRAHHRNFLEAKHRARGLCPGNHPSVVLGVRYVFDSSPRRPTSRFFWTSQFIFMLHNRMRTVSLATFFFVIYHG